jgi:hypothetical protein
VLRHPCQALATRSQATPTLNRARPFSQSSVAAAGFCQSSGPRCLLAGRARAPATTALCWTASASTEATHAAAPDETQSYTPTPNARLPSRKNERVRHSRYCANLRDGPLSEKFSVISSPSTRRGTD